MPFNKSYTEVHREDTELHKNIWKYEKYCFTLHRSNIKFFSSMKYRFVLIFSLLAGIVAAQTSKKWDYPKDPEVWSKAHNRPERIAACQIPEKVLAALSTEELAVICLEYPFIANVLSFIRLDNGLDKLFNDFNGIRELFDRKDALAILLKHYQAKKKELAEAEARRRKEDIIISVAVLEALLSRYQSQYPANEDNREILQHLVDGYEKQVAHAENLFNKNIAFRTNYFARAKVIARMSEQNDEELALQEDDAAMLTGMVDESAVGVINEMSYRLIR